MNKEIYNQKLLLTRVDFDRDKKPRLRLSNQETEKFYDFNLDFENDITIKIDTSQRYCIGWHDLKTGQDFVCPEKSIVEPKYEQCQKCQKRTGFNPAFYNAAEGDISDQQQIRNSQPHFVYLAHFTSGIVKVGITYAGREKARLLEQGARSALILGEFPTANVARSYEARISAMSDFCENVKATAKIKFLEKCYNQESAKNELLGARDKVESLLGVKFDENEVEFFDQYYSSGVIPHGEFISADEIAKSDQIIFSGKLKAQIGYILIAEQQGEKILISARKFTGYLVEISNQAIELKLPERQASLFDF